MWFGQMTTTLMGALLVLSALAVPFENSRYPSNREIPSTHALHERQASHVKHVWKRGSKVHSSAVLPMRIGLHQRNLQEGHDLLMDRSNHKSPNFGKRMTSREVIDFFAPPRESVEAVRDWIVAGGILVSRISQSTNKQWIQFDATTEEVENLLHTDFYHWHHDASGVQDIAAEEYHLPADLRRHVDYITPGIRLRTDTSRPKKRSQQNKQRRGITPAANGTLTYSPPSDPNVCNVTHVTPQCVQKLYQIPKGSRASVGNELGIFETISDHYSKEDLDVYHSTIYPDVPNGTYPIEESIDGAYGASNSTATAGIESNLDFQAAIPLIYPQKTILFQTDDEVYQTNTSLSAGFLNTFFDALDGSYCTFSAFNETGNCVTDDCLDPVYPDPNPGGYKGQLQCGVYEPTNVISISYSTSELAKPPSYLKRQCAEIMKLGLQGTTVVMATGDHGVGPTDGETTCTGYTGKVFTPQENVVCPYVLAVGATELVEASGNTSSPQFIERAPTDFGSGGGFSNFFDTPSYQANHVKNYFNNVTLNFTGYNDIEDVINNATSGVYRIGGRGYPDVAAIGDNWVERIRGFWISEGGTSLATPIWASVLTLINEERISVGKGPLGFINPTLYAHPEVFNDVTVGSNPNCNTTGFLATEGWDPVTGLGTPIYPKLLSLLKDLP